MTGCGDSARGPLADGTEAQSVVLPEFRLAAFPLQRVPGLRHLVDAQFRPFLLHGDTAWSMLVQLTRDETEGYLEDRRQRGFNTLLVNLLEYTYSAQPPRNRFGEGPFVRAGDYATPNERYFEHVAWVLQAAARKGILILLAPSYIGCCNDGWYASMVKNGPEEMRTFGRYLGQRFRGFGNIMWVHGGDANPGNQRVVGEIALGIREADTVSLHTAHTAPGFQAMDIWSAAPWMDVNNVYTYDPVAPLSLRAHARADRMPFFLIESEYEGENRRAPDVRIRAQAWHTVLSGAMGQVMGNNPIWHFASPRPITPFKTTWQQAMGSEASRSMTQLRRLLESLPWWRLQPDAHGNFLVGTPCEGHERAVASRSDDGKVALAYLPQRRRFRLAVDEDQWRLMRTRWFDPVSGRFGAPFSAAADGPGRLVSIPPAGVNAGGDTDWVLVVEDRGGSTGQT
jgi:Protein of unknown function (DUF4038)/Putative collagen-binding domain of a collagenase